MLLAALLPWVAEDCAVETRASAVDLVGAPLDVEDPEEVVIASVVLDAETALVKGPEGAKDASLTDATEFELPPTDENVLSADTDAADVVDPTGEEEGLKVEAVILLATKLFAGGVEPAALMVDITLVSEVDHFDPDAESLVEIASLPDMLEEVLIFPVTREPIEDDVMIFVVSKPEDVCMAEDPGDTGPDVPVI